METSLFTELLKLYSFHRRTLYLNYFEEFRLLVGWLGPQVPAESGASMLSWYQGNYEIQELAKILGASQELVLQTLKELEARS